MDFSNHFSERLQERFKLTIDQLKSQFGYFKIASTQCKFKTLVTKVAKDPSNKYFYHEKLNLVISICPRSKTAITAMFIDNPDWTVRTY